MNNPKVSIIVVIYNRIKYIEECLISIVKQNIDKEVILVDDYSTDGTIEILQRFVKKYSGFILYQNKEHMGTVLTRYNGLKYATGEYVLFVDADDIIVKDSICKLYNETKKSNADILEFSVETDSKDVEFRKSLLKNNKKFTNNLTDVFKQNIISNTLCNKFISKKVYTKILNEINPSVKQVNFSDVIFFMYHLLMNSQNLVQSKTVGYYYYRYRGMTANLSNEDCLKQYIGFIATKKELNKIYGKIDALEYTLKKVQKQALCVYSQLNKENKIKYLPELAKLMNCG